MGRSVIKKNPNKQRKKPGQWTDFTGAIHNQAPQLKLAFQHDLATYIYSIKQNLYRDLWKHHLPVSNKATNDVETFCCLFYVEVGSVLNAKPKVLLAWIQIWTGTSCLCCSVVYGVPFFPMQVSGEKLLQPELLLCAVMYHLQDPSWYF